MVFPLLPVIPITCNVSNCFLCAIAIFCKAINELATFKKLASGKAVVSMFSSITKFLNPRSYTSAINECPFLMCVCKAKNKEVEGKNHKEL